jgi:AAT family amino acid transporter
MLYNLGLQGQAPRTFAKTSPGGVPRKAVLVSVTVLLFGVLLNYLVPEKVFVWVTSISTFGAIWTWAVILLSHRKFRAGLSPAQLDGLEFKMPLYPAGTWIALAFLVLVVGLMAYFPDTRIALFVGPAFLILLVVLYYALGLGKRVAAIESR